MVTHQGSRGINEFGVQPTSNHHQHSGLGAGGMGSMTSNQMGQDESRDLPKVRMDEVVPALPSPMHDPLCQAMLF